MFDIVYSVSEFIQKGGDVLIIIFLVAFVMWSIILDKLFLHFFLYPKNIKKTTLQNKQWNKKKFLEIKEQLDNNMALLKITILASPLLGLLGTVTGMIEVFDVISILGNSDAKAMSNGISQATIPTMAGMSVALSGMIFKVYIEQSNKKKLRVLSERLQINLKAKRRGK